MGHPRLATIATGSARHPGRRPDRAPQDGQLPRAARPRPRGQVARRAVPRRGAGHPGRARIPPPTCGPTRAVWAQSGTTTGTGGSGRSLSLPQLTAGPRGDPHASETREGPDHAGFPGGRRPRGDLTRAVFGVVSAHPPRRRDSTCRTSRATSCPCPRPGTAPGRTWPGAPSRGRPAGYFAASGSRAGTSPGEGPAPPREASAEPVVHGRGRDLSDTGQTTEGPVVDTLLSDGADKAS